jgi:asparagine synthase (glutamine-hydrolysing)
MCRIAGRVSKDKTDFSSGLAKMLTSMKHGGPDDEGIYADGLVTLGHKRLSIIDLSKAGHQPMICKSSNAVISFNGEIYNYMELRKELEANGYNFDTHTDTEVILKAYQCWGTKAFIRLEGIFAFALYDKQHELFLLVRDHIGVKPLYYYLDDNQLLFSSEVRAFKELSNEWQENPDWRILFLAFGSIPHPFTDLLRVFQLAPGTYLRVNLNDFTSSSVFYYNPGPCDYQITTSEDAKTQIQFSVQKAIQKNLIADAPLGIFLSGGIDSSLITLLADRYLHGVRTLSVNFDDAHYDEHPFQQLVLERTENVRHTSHRISEHMFWDDLNDIWKAMDQPSIDAVNAYFIAKFAKEERVKAVLSGLGADEIFGGYSSFKRIKWMRVIRKLPYKKHLSRQLEKIKKSWARFVYLKLDGAIGDYLFLRGIHTPSEIAELLKVSEDQVWAVLSKVPLPNLSKLNDEEYASMLESNIYMRNQLLKDADYMGMWHGVEVRLPFLDTELLGKVRTIPPSIRYRNDSPKFLLTASFKHLLPHKVIFRNKKGFTFPFEVWMERSSNRFISLMPDEKITHQLYKQFTHGHCHWSKCWSLAVLNQFNKY